MKVVCKVCVQKNLGQGSTISDDFSRYMEGKKESFQLIVRSALALPSSKSFEYWLDSFELLFIMSVIAVCIENLPFFPRIRLTRLNNK